MPRLLVPLPPRSMLPVEVKPLRQQIAAAGVDHDADAGIGVGVGDGAVVGDAVVGIEGDRRRHAVC